MQYILQALVELPHTRLLIAGDGSYRAHLAWLAETFNVAERVTFLGAVPRTELPRLYASVDLVVGASFVNETFGIALVEAQACGTPVVTANYGAMQEVAGDAALCVDPRDSAALAEAMTSVVEDDTLAQRLVEQGLERARSFRWERTGRRVHTAYRHLLEGSAH